MAIIDSVRTNNLVLSTPNYSVSRLTLVNVMSLKLCENTPKNVRGKYFSLKLWLIDPFYYLIELFPFNLPSNVLIKSGCKIFTPSLLDLLHQEK